MRIALAQQAASLDREANAERALENVARAAGGGADLIVFPELAVDRFFPAERRDDDADPRAEPVPGPLTSRLQEAAARHRIVIVFNLYERAEDGRHYDSSPVIDADGSLLGATRMVHIAQFPGFWEQDYYTPGDRGAPVYDTAAGRVGVAICYDRHFPEYLRALALAKADLVAIPQAGAIDEWPDGLFEAEVRTAAFQNGYFVALCNRVGVEEKSTFAGESFVVDPEGRVLARGRRLEEDLVTADLDLGAVADSTARRLFFRDRRPDLYTEWFRHE